jgi:hypothetical protein
MLRFVRGCCLTASFAMLARPVAAQVAVGLRPFVGYYRPFGHFFRAPYLSTALPQRPSDLQGVAWGGDVQVTLRKRFAIVARGLTTTTTLPSCTCPGGPTDPAPVRVSMAIVEGQYDLSPAPARYHLRATGGPALIRNSGPGYEQPDSPVSWGGAFGFELALRLASSWQLVGTGTGVAYAFVLDSPPQRGPMRDAILSIGVRWHSGS